MTSDKTSLFDLTGQTALITGAYSYLGTEISKTLSNAGAKVILQGRDEKKLLKLQTDLKNSGGEAEVACFDLLSPSCTTAFLNKTKNSPLNILVNNAYAGTSGGIQDIKSDDFRQSYEISVIKAFEIIQALLPALEAGRNRNNNASVINMSSMYGKVAPYPDAYPNKQQQNPSFYGAAKSALIQFSRYTAIELASKKIRVNCLCPGPFPSIEVQKLNPDFIKRLESKSPMGRVGQAAELGGPILFLASSASSYMTGADLDIDGGWTKW